MLTPFSLLVTPPTTKSFFHFFFMMLFRKDLATFFSMGDIKINNFIESVFRLSFARLISVNTEKAHRALSVVYAAPFVGTIFC